MNSRVPFDKKYSRHAYGLHLDKQNETLDQMINTAKSLKVYGSEGMYQFQKGIIVSSQSLKQLYRMVKEKYSLSLCINAQAESR